MWEDAQSRANDLDILNVFETSANSDRRDTVVELFNEITLQLAKNPPTLIEKPPIRLSQS